MDNCCKLVHPFQNDPGVSQQQRLVNELLASAPKIDGRSMADLLDYFKQLSKNINFYYYEENQDQLTISDWSGFFEKSTPFLLTSIIKYEKDSINKQLENYNNLFKRKPSKQALQLILHYIFRQTIAPINKWSVELKDSQLTIKSVLEKLIRDKLNGPVKKFVCLSNIAVQQFNIKKIDFGRLRDNPLWNFQQEQDASILTCFTPKDKSRRKKLLQLRKQIMEIIPAIFEATRVAGTSAELVLNDSFEPMKDEFRQKTQPHLALIFAFLKLFGYLQNDLNNFTRKHLDFFYSDVLKLKALDAIPDKAHILFEIQTQLQKYKLGKGLKLKAGKDENKVETLFTLEDEIIVNKAEIADVKTLFVNNRPINNTAYVEGVYMAPDASRADGIKMDFNDEGQKTWPGMGAKFSKYTEPETNLFRQYPNAKLGFALASPVLYLQEGKRTIDITIACELKENYCDLLADPEPDKVNKCCDQVKVAALMKKSVKKILPFVEPKTFLEQVASSLKTTYYHLYLPSIPSSLKDLKDKVKSKLRNNIKRGEKKICYCPTDSADEVLQFTQGEWDRFLEGFLVSERTILKNIFKAKNLLKILLSGATEWIEPSSMTSVTLLSGVNESELVLQFSITLEIDKPAVTFFDSGALKEEIKTEWPVIKVELDDSIKMEKTTAELLEFLDELRSGENCCIGKKLPDNHVVSFYHFFRNLVVVDEVTAHLQEENVLGLFKTGIDVTVCGLTKFIVQNDESLQDVNGPIFPFGTRPEVIDFNVVAPSYCITQDLVNDALVPPNAISDSARKVLENFLKPDIKKFRIAKHALGKFLDQEFPLPPPPSGAKYSLTEDEKNKIRGLINDPNKNYCRANLIGPNFYIGSKEVFCKKWTEVFIDLNWKNKPSDFRDHYKAYVAKPDENNPGNLVYGIDEKGFEINLSVLDDGKWFGERVHNSTADETIANTKTETNNRKLFPDASKTSFCYLVKKSPFEQTIHLTNNYFTAPHDFSLDKKPFEPYQTNSQNGFLKINLQNQDFLHKNYPYVLARQMMALGMLAAQPENKSKPKIEDAVYYDENGNVIVFSSNAIRTDVEKAVTLSALVENAINDDPGGIKKNAGYPGSGPIPEPKAEDIRRIILPDQNDPTLNSTDPTIDLGQNLTVKVVELEQAISRINTGINNDAPFQAIIPNEPWTPVIKNIAIDYKASADITDIDLIHLFPYKDTYKEVDIEKQPALFPTFCDEGNLFIGLKNLIPGSNVNMLFQLAEATADSELDPEEVRWYYLENNLWRRLRTGFEVVKDDTENLSTSGIIKFALPESMTKDNTILPKEWHWIRASIAKNSRLVCEIIGIHTQAIKANFVPAQENSLLRLSNPLPKGSISSLEQPDSSIKKVDQPYESFGGDVPELEGKFYLRVSELLRHKGRAIQKWDYERIILQAFPQIYKAKCITHSFGLDANRYDNDFPIAAGYILLAVIPDLNILKAGKSFEPKAPLSLLEKIGNELKLRVSPFVRIKVMNPRYEKVNFCFKVRLRDGMDEIYYKEKLAQDIREFMAPWAIGEFHKLHFGQCINRSDIIQFLETRDYVDFIIELKMGHERDSAISDKAYSICPHTPRSILIAGDIDVCIPENDCEAQTGQCNNPAKPVIDYCATLIRTPENG